MKILLANDTAVSWHIGCQAVSDGHARMLGRAGHEVLHRVFLRSLDRHAAGRDDDVVASLRGDESLMARIEAVDAVVVNGEGTIHHGRGRPLLGLLELAQSLKKPTFLVNAVFQDSDSFLPALKRLDDFTVRDGRSLAYAESLGLRARRVADSVLAATFDEAPADLTGDVVSDGHSQRKDAVAALDGFRAATGAAWLPFDDKRAQDSWRTVPARLKGADILVTGRHHGIYMALKAGIPFVALGSNTFKVEGVLEDLGRTDLLAASLDDILAIRARVVTRRDDFAHLADRLTGGEPLTTFRALGVAGPSREEAEVARLLRQRDQRWRAMRREKRLAAETASRS